jgi:hypothetical protein
MYPEKVAGLVITGAQGYMKVPWAIATQKR